MPEGYTSVYFNAEQCDLYKELVTEKKISQSFNEFVKVAYHEKIDNLRSEKTFKQQIEQETEKTITDLSKKAAKNNE